MTLCNEFVLKCIGYNLSMTQCDDKVVCDLGNICAYGDDMERCPGAPFNIETIFLSIGIHSITITGFWDQLIFEMGIHIQVKWLPNTELAHRVI